MGSTFHDVYCEKALIQLSKLKKKVHLTFLDPPFNQGKKYENHNDNMPEEYYWNWMYKICKKVYQLSHNGASIYFMQREKNTDNVMKCLVASDWIIHNIIVWKKKTSVLPYRHGFGKGYQIIIYATKGKKPTTFNRLRINPPLPKEYKQKRENGISLTDVWDDIRELTAGYYASEEALRNYQEERLHKQQSPISLLLRIILSSTVPQDNVLDCFAGTGTTGIVAKQLERNSILIDNSANCFDMIKKRLLEIRIEDSIDQYATYYRYTKNLDRIWLDVQKLLPKTIESWM